MDSKHSLPTSQSLATSPGAKSPARAKAPARAKSQARADARDAAPDQPVFRSDEAAALREGHHEVYRPVDAAMTPIDAAQTKQPAAGAYPSTDGNAHPGVPYPPEVDPNVRMDGGEYEPVSEIDTIRRTLEVPASRRGPGSPPDDREGALSGSSGARRRE
ncbi:DUF2934 domain-containing protein [Ancylobacter mangrovi]|uniref:DUF2934 domain-containing protein n=1 Tax=Ancylobacter mangrovi TaxID=2972472 RepID=UPI002163B856|nr:DUF2934 domain-containing protein [Ancylobacter mangrovi]MCS0501230.1 DUF2934 domain-containing protein [Ancylobacter mangrovi]